MAIEDVASSLSSTTATSARGRNRARPVNPAAPEELPAGRFIASWPMVDCAGAGCMHQANWRDCFEECVYTKKSVDMIGDDDEEFFTTYFCYRCMAVKWGCDEADAVIRSRDDKPGVECCLQHCGGIGRRRCAWRIQWPAPRPRD